MFCVFIYVWYYVTFVVSFVFCFFFKQKTAYEMRISDWSSDVCSSDLGRGADELAAASGDGRAKRIVRRAQHALAGRDLRLEPIDRRLQVRQDRKSVV